MQMHFFISQNYTLMKCMKKQKQMQTPATGKTAQPRETTADSEADASKAAQRTPALKKCSNNRNKPEVEYE